MTRSRMQRHGTREALQKITAYAHIEYGSKECDGNFCFERRNTLNLYFKEHASWGVKVV